MNFARRGCGKNQPLSPYPPRFLPCPPASQVHYHPSPFWESNGGGSAAPSDPHPSRSGKISDTLFCISAVIFYSPSAPSWTNRSFPPMSDLAPWASIFSNRQGRDQERRVCDWPWRIHFCGGERSGKEGLYFARRWFTLLFSYFKIIIKKIIILQFLLS